MGDVTYSISNQYVEIPCKNAIPMYSYCLKSKANFYVDDVNEMKNQRSKIEKVPRDIQGDKSRKDKISSAGLIHWSISKFQKGTEPGVRKSKLSLQVCHIRCK